MKPQLVACSALMLTGVANSAAPTYHRDIPANLASEAKKFEVVALSTALGAVPNGKVLSTELEREKGKLVYSVDIKAPRKSGVEEIHVSAVDGSLLSREHESTKTERREVAAEKRKGQQKPKN
jgi:hypothetical protein